MAGRRFSPRPKGSWGQRYGGTSLDVEYGGAVGRGTVLRRLHSNTAKPGTLHNFSALVKRCVF